MDGNADWSDRIFEFKVTWGWAERWQAWLWVGDYGSWVTGTWGFIKLVPLLCLFKLFHHTDVKEKCKPHSVCSSRFALDWSILPQRATFVSRCPTSTLGATRHTGPHAHTGSHAHMGPHTHMGPPTHIGPPHTHLHHTQLPWCPQRPPRNQHKHNPYTLSTDMSPLAQNTPPNTYNTVLTNLVPVLGNADDDQFPRAQSGPNSLTPSFISSYTHIPLTPPHRFQHFWTAFRMLLSIILDSLKCHT